MDTQLAVFKGRKDTEKQEESIAMKKRAINVKGSEISVYSKGQEDYISLTDMVKTFGDESIIYNWLRNRNTIEFLGIWEQLYNPDFKPVEFERFKSQAGLNRFALSPKKWIEATNARGLISKAGRYGGGTFAHKDIAFEFGSWLSPEFKLYLIKEFQRLKEEEYRTQSLEQLVVLSNLESINAVLIHQGLGQPERLRQLNDIAINQMKSLVGVISLKRLENQGKAD